MKITLFEYASGGGFQGKSIPTDMLCEGYSMLKAASDDFRAAGYIVETLLDSRLSNLRNPLGARSLAVSSAKMLPSVLDNSIRSSDLSLILAPETGGLLADLVEHAAKFKTPVLNSEPDAIRRVSNKTNFLAEVRRRGLPTPETVRLSIEDGVEEARRALGEFKFKAVFKPLDGVGCEGLSIVRDASEVSGAIEKISCAHPSGSYLVQEFVEGLPASVSLLADGQNAKPLSLNRQDIRLEPPSGSSCYSGGLVPLEHRDRDKAFEFARIAVESFQGLKGYVGVDLVLSPKGPVLIEVNPRLTVSYTGLRLVAATNLAEAIVNSVIRKELPETRSTNGVSVFKKIRGALIRLEPQSNDCQVLCPPLRTEDRATSCAFLAAKGTSEAEALEKLQGGKRA